MNLVDSGQNLARTKLGPESTKLGRLRPNPARARPQSAPCSARQGQLQSIWAQRWPSVALIGLVARSIRTPCAELVQHRSRISLIRSVGRSVGRSASRSTDRSIGRSVGRSIGRPGSRSVGQPSGRPGKGRLSGRSCVANLDQHCATSGHLRPSSARIWPFPTRTGQILVRPVWKSPPHTAPRSRIERNSNNLGAMPERTCFCFPLPRPADTNRYFSRALGLRQRGEEAKRCKTGTMPQGLCESATRLERLIWQLSDCTSVRTDYGAWHFGNMYHNLVRSLSLETGTAAGSMPSNSGADRPALCDTRAHTQHGPPSA